MIHQREIGIDTTSFAEALKGTSSGPRRDNDRRDEGFGTVRAALTAAETGHLVLAASYARRSSKHRSDLRRLSSPSTGPGQAPACKRPDRHMFTAALAPSRWRQDGRHGAHERAGRAKLREEKNPRIEKHHPNRADQGMHTMDQDLARLIKRATALRTGRLLCLRH